MKARRLTGVPMAPPIASLDVARRDLLEAAELHAARGDDATEAALCRAAVRFAAAFDEYELDGDRDAYRLAQLVERAGIRHALGFDDWSPLAEHVSHRLGRVRAGYEGISGPLWPLTDEEADDADSFRLASHRLRLIVEMVAFIDELEDLMAAVGAWTPLSVNWALPTAPALFRTAARKVRALRSALRHAVTRGK